MRQKTRMRPENEEGRDRKEGQRQPDAPSSRPTLSCKAAARQLSSNGEAVLLALQASGITFFPLPLHSFPFFFPARLPSAWQPGGGAGAAQDSTA